MTVSIHPTAVKSPTPVVSPSLLASEKQALPAYEIKFLIPEAAALEVEAQLRDHLVLDPYSDPTLGNAYRVTSVYYDTPRFDVYRRAGSHGEHKFRVRSYGTDEFVYLEQKSKRNGQVRKRRTRVVTTEVGRTADDLATLTGWPGEWFALQLAERELKPVCRVTYERKAFVGTDPGGAIRATFDRAARGIPNTDPRPEPFSGGVRLMQGEVIVEFKFLGTLPALFKQIMDQSRLSPTGGSKYRRCVDACGVTPEGSACA